MIRIDEMISKATNPFTIAKDELHSVDSGKSVGSKESASGVDPKLEKAVSDFESIFIFQMLKGMRNNVMKSDLFGDGKAEEVYTSMLDQELSSVMSKGNGVGLKDMLLRQFSSPDASGNPAGRGFFGDDGKGEMIPIKPGPGAIKEFNKFHTEEPNIINPEALKKDINFRVPVNGSISSAYGMRADPYNGKKIFHKGMDIAAPEGTPIYPAMEGEVIFSGKRGGYGNVVEIKHRNGYISRYAHNRENLVSSGDHVGIRDKIAEVGSSGRSTGPHLHLEFRVEGMAVNPYELVDFG